MKVFWKALANLQQKTPLLLNVFHSYGFEHCSASALQQFHGNRSVSVTWISSHSIGIPVSGGVSRRCAFLIGLLHGGEDLVERLSAIIQHDAIT